MNRHLGSELLTGIYNMSDIKYKKFKYNSRQWLNKEEDSSASINSGILVDTGYAEATIVIRDCSRQITLDFDFDGRQETSFNARIEKIDLIIKELEQFRAHMLFAYPIVLENEELYSSWRESNKLEEQQAVVA